MKTNFSSPYGIAPSPAITRIILTSSVEGREYQVNYQPAESDSDMFGGNSNWRGPVWMPVNALILRSLLSVLPLLRRQFQNRVPDRIGPLDEPVRGRPRDRQSPRQHLPAGSNPAGGQCIGGTEKFQTDPPWRDYILFYEYFHGDNGAGLGASHQTGMDRVGREADRAFPAYGRRPSPCLRLICAAFAPGELLGAGHR